MAQKALRWILRIFSNHEGIPEKWDRDPGVGPRTRDPRVGPWDGTLGLDPGMGP